MFSLIRHLIFTIYFNLVGAVSNLEDLLFRWANKCELQSHTGEVAVITGGARGIGLEVVRQLLKCDYHVIIGCRSVEAGKKAVHKLESEGVTSGTTTILPLDMASLDSVRQFAEAVINNTPKINLLINNAGIMNPPYTETVDGYESQWQVNYLGHFLLSHLLISRLSVTDGAPKIINVSSCAHLSAYPIDFSDINMKNNFITQAAYSQSKVAQIMFTQYLDRALRDVNSPVRVVAVHPGVVNTAIFDSTTIKRVAPFIPKLFFKSPKQGATTVMYAALHGKGGEYISNGRSAYTSQLARDKHTQEKLFKYSKETLGISKFGGQI